MRPAEAADTSHDLRGIESGAVDDLKRLADLGRGQPAQQELGAAGDDTEQVVEMMRRSRRYFADGPQSFAADELGLRPGELVVGPLGLLVQLRVLDGHRRLVGERL